MLANCSALEAQPSLLRRSSTTRGPSIDAAVWRSPDDEAQVALFHRAAVQVGLDLQPCFAVGKRGGSEVKIYYILSMSLGLGLKELVENTASWPKDDQDELAEVAAEIEGGGPVVMPWPMQSAPR